MVDFKGFPWNWWTVCAACSMPRPAFYLYQGTGGNMCLMWFLLIHAPDVPKFPVHQTPYQSAYWRENAVTV